MKLKTAVNRAIAELTLESRDFATAELARHQAQMIDEDSQALKRVGPQLLETLTALGMTPKSRAVAVKGTGNDGRRGKLAAIHSLRA